VAQVVSRKEEFEAANSNIITVSFGTPYWANVWLQETGSPFPFLVDQDRVSYATYGLESSVFRSWSPANLWYYTKAVLQKRETFGKRGNPHQLGGDFIIDPCGKLQLAHPSKDPTDRPAIDDLLGILRRQNGKAC
jgi:peroxiredoxin